MAINVYDFDGTIYRGDSTVDFYLYCMRRHPKIICELPRTMIHYIFYKTGRCTKTRFKEVFYGFLRHLSDVDALVARFWERKAGRIKQWYLLQKTQSDMIISASPEFLLRPICSALELPPPIASRVDKRTGRTQGENCRGAEKVRRLRETKPGCVIGQFYSDSRSDEPLAALAKESFYVKKGRITPWYQ